MWQRLLECWVGWWYHHNDGICSSSSSHTLIDQSSVRLQCREYACVRRNKWCLFYSCYEFMGGVVRPLASIIKVQLRVVCCVERVNWSIIISLLPLSSHSSSSPSFSLCHCLSSSLSPPIIISAWKMYFLWSPTLMMRPCSSLPPSSPSYPLSLLHTNLPLQRYFILDFFCFSKRNKKRN